MSDEERGPFRSVAFVARMLGLPERSLRRQLVPAVEWRETRRATGAAVVDHTTLTGTVPSVRVGAMYRIPAWWLTAMLDAARSD